MVESKRLWTVDVNELHPTIYTVDADEVMRVYGHTSAFSTVYPQVYMPDVSFQEAQDLHEIHWLLWFALRLYVDTYGRSTTVCDSTVFVESQRSRQGSLCSLLSEARYAQNPPANLNDLTRQRIERLIDRFGLGIWKFNVQSNSIKWELQKANLARLWERFPIPPIYGVLITLLADFLHYNLKQKQILPSMLTSALVRFFTTAIPCDYGFNAYEYIVWYMLAVLLSMYISDTSQILEQYPFCVRINSACTTPILHAIRLFDPALFVWMQF